ncbi:transposable element Tcb1 transposase [Trichonephila clavipes]|nr:transposable element Tcb1 transposase [Trichonephila clavipes]
MKTWSYLKQLREFLFESEQAKMLSVGPDAMAQPVTVSEEKCLPRTLRISADEMCEEKEERSVDVIKETAKEDINPVVLSGEPLNLNNDEIEEIKQKGWFIYKPNLKAPSNVIFVQHNWCKYTQVQRGSCDPEDFDALTPGYFIVGRPITATAEPSLTEVSDNSSTDLTCIAALHGGSLVVLAVTAKGNRLSTASDLSRQLSSATGTTVSMQTVYRHLGHIGLYARRPVRCVPLTATHCHLRLTWSREHALWTPQQWSCVMFSDESRFSLQSDSHRTSIWRAPGTSYHQENTIEQHHYGGAG